MHDGKLLIDNEVESTENRGGTAAIAARMSGRRTPRANLWTVVGFCIAGLICSFFVPTSYLHFEQTPALLAEPPLS